jgi:hypothetical protein
MLVAGISGPAEGARRAMARTEGTQGPLRLQKIPGTSKHVALRRGRDCNLEGGKIDTRGRGALSDDCRLIKMEARDNCRNHQACRERG